MLISKRSTTSSNTDCIVTQVHIPDFDVQGGLPAVDKQHLVAFGLKHLRAFNQNAYIVLVGHGHRPAGIEVCDHVRWDDRQIPLTNDGYVVGMPAQFKYVWEGLDHVKKRGFKRCVKTRGDCLIGIPNITANCNQILDLEQRQLVITQMTGPEYLGDCFMAGNVDLLWRTWHRDNPVKHHNGLINTAVNYQQAVHGNTAAFDLAAWPELLRSTCAFRDVHKLKFVCLRWNYFKLDKLSESVQHQLLNPGHDFAKWHWGLTHNRHLFDADGNMTGVYGWLWSEKTFYQASTNGHDCHNRTSPAQIASA